MYVKYFAILILASANAKVIDNTHVINDLFNKREEKRIDLTEDKAPGLKKNVGVTNVINVTEPTTEKSCIDANILDNIIDSSAELCEPKVKVDNGTALILTPFIKEGRINEARNASKVDPGIFLGVESYSGFLTVNETYNSNLFFWYFPVPRKPVSETPWIIWLQGGPGASSMTGLFDELGPFTVDKKGTLLPNPYTWLQNHSLVFIENPVGTGYSFTEHNDGYARDMRTYTMHLFEALEQFLQLFPELRKAPLYIAGESYAGKYVPALAAEVHEHNVDVNFQGIMLGNAYVDPSIISNISMNFYHFGLVDRKQIEIAYPIAESFARAIANNNSIEAKNKWTSLVSLLLLMTNLKQGYNYLKEELTVGRYNTFLDRSEVKRALHVGDIKYSFVNGTVNVQIAPDFLSSTKPQLVTILDNYRVLTFCGQLDQFLGCEPTSEFYRTLQWKKREDFLNSTRLPFMFQRKLAGYHKSGGGLTEVLVRGAGHMAAMDTPAPVQRFIALWTHGLRLGPRFIFLENYFLTALIKNATTVANV